MAQRAEKRLLIHSLSLFSPKGDQHCSTLGRAADCGRSFCAQRGLRLFAMRLQNQRDDMQADLNSVDPSLWCRASLCAPSGTYAELMANPDSLLISMGAVESTSPHGSGARLKEMACRQGCLHLFVPLVGWDSALVRAIAAE